VNVAMPHLRGKIVPIMAMLLGSIGRGSVGMERAGFSSTTRGSRSITSGAYKESTGSGSYRKLRRVLNSVFGVVLAITSFYLSDRVSDAVLDMPEGHASITIEPKRNGVARCVPFEAATPGLLVSSRCKQDGASIPRPCRRQPRRLFLHPYRSAIKLRVVSISDRQGSVLQSKQ